MNTKQRLSNDLLNDGEIIIEKRFVKLYESEIDKIDEQISDLKKLDQKDFDAKGEVEEKARAYYRAFARESMEVFYMITILSGLFIKNRDQFH